MTPQNVRFFDRRKFMWDGAVYDSRAAAEAKKGDYEAQQFETQLVRADMKLPCWRAHPEIEEDAKFLLYTRRVVKEAVVQGEPPAA